MKIIPLSSVEVRKRQRTTIAAKPLEELKHSILTVGLLHPPVMWQDGEKWVLSVGERRLRAIQEIHKEDGTRCFNCGELIIQAGTLPITPLGDYLDEIGRFDAELAENIYREDIEWQDRVQAMADLHAMRLKTNPKQSLTATAKELADGGAFAKHGEGIHTRGNETSPTDAPGSTARIKLSNAVTIAQHFDDPAIVNARNENEALSLIYRKEEDRIQAELIRRSLARMTVASKIEVRHGDLLSLLPVLTPGTFDLILADPPYGIDAGSAGFRARTVHHHNYEDDPDTARAIARSILTEGFKLTKPRANVFIFCAIEYFDWLKQVSANMGWTPFNRPLIWIKSESEGLAPWGSLGPRITTEFIFYATKGQKGLVASPIDVFNYKRVARGERIHAAEKPVELLSRLIECSTLPGDSVLDPCCGSGSTLVACKTLKRVGLGIEKDETYFNAALSNIHGGGSDDENQSTEVQLQGTDRPKVGLGEVQGS